MDRNYTWNKAPSEIINTENSHMHYYKNLRIYMKYMWAIFFEKLYQVFRCLLVILSQDMGKPKKQKLKSSGWCLSVRVCPHEQETVGAAAMFLDILSPC